MSKGKVHLLYQDKKYGEGFGCGGEYAGRWTTDPSAVTCLRCQRTTAYREAAEKEKKA